MNLDNAESIINKFETLLYRLFASAELSAAEKRVPAILILLLVLMSARLGAFWALLNELLPVKGT